MAKYLVLFGAGASFGSESQGVPPLGNALLNELVKYNPTGWGKIPSGLDEVFKADFESGVKRLSEVYSHALPPLQRAMAAYFFNFKPNHTSLYYSLAQKLSQVTWDGAFVTVNYERLLELSLLASGVQPFIGTLPIGYNKSVELCLPHGCCHLFCESVRGNAQGISFSGINVTTNGPIKVIAGQSEFYKRIQEDAFPPVMSYFEPSKQTTSGANFIAQQRGRFAELTRTAETIVIIGLRVREHDLHIWEPISKTEAKIVYISGDTAGKEFESWKERNRKGMSDVILHSYFKENFSDILKYLGL